MNIFAHIKPIARYSKVSYYSLVLNDNSLSLFEEFVAVQTESNKSKLNHILSWIKIIGIKYGAQIHHFRSEAKIADTSALPPKGVKREPAYIEKGKKSSNMLRLYTFRLNENVVFLFNGDLKTSRYAQDCPNVSPHFHLANKLTAAIQDALEEKEIRWIDDFTQIEFEQDFKLEL
ncbi:hypothetical protein SAMN05444483_105185 [Salegentibacter echinorum]|uniref:Uncharacterized protein n=1 Tax=Salegentibacter echinorum TaxID=1073325 RepID=A0A1M5HK72_SALEC|nr:hypothetical protein [Salegentibacter echinorum]SHG16354.1 hypothetical protein SAMN05444483_105185 [Salegentibacter echinorum]